ncbi:MAG: Na+/H+ antiporter subunit D [Actinophytocola sp.]|nr:Na+/H+ antiporter subunit D [Actinophytocola sp.]
MSVLVAVPVLLPLLAAGLALVLSQVGQAQRVIAVAVLAAVMVDAAVLLAVVDDTGALVLRLGGYGPPFGITLVADRLSALLLLVSSVITLAVLAYSISQRVTDYGRAPSSTSFHPIYLVMCAGVALAYLTADLFNLFVSFEIMLAASYVLITRGTTAKRVQANMTYVIVSLTSSLLFITLIALVYAATGTVNFAELEGRVADIAPGAQLGLALLALVVFGIKSAIVPLHFWLPDSYPTAPAPVTAVFAGLLTKVGIYAVIRTQTVVFTHADTWNLLLFVALVTMIIGVLGALAQVDINRLLSFLLVSHIGFMLFGLALFSPLGLTGVILYILHHITVQTALFLIAGLITRHTATVSIRDMGGVAGQRPWLAVVFAVPALSLAGIPPLSGFIAKITLLQGGVEADSVTAYAVAFGAIATSLLTLYAMARIWVMAFWGEPPERAPDKPDAVETAGSARPMLLVCASLVAFGLVIAAAAGPLSEVAGRAAVNLLDGGVYRSAVLGGDVR